MSDETATIPTGDTQIKPKVAFSLALNAALNTYGVLGIASRHSTQDCTQRDPQRGLEVKLSDGDDGKTHATVTVHIISQYGVRLQSVASSLQNQITYAIEHGTGYVVDAVHVHMAAVRITTEEMRNPNE